MSETRAAQRPLPAINEMNRHFWQSGETGQLRLLRCSDCGTWIHPYAGLCPSCRSSAIAPQPVSGRATVVSFTVNVQPWFPHVPTPYVIALVELEEQSNLRLVTNLPTCPIEDVRIGLPVEVFFERHDDIYVPLFRPR
jgi:uncharacterized OB-fold protein